MNAKQLIAAVFALTAASAVFAQQAEVTGIQSGKTRAQVVAELAQAQKDGTVGSYSFVGNINPAATAGNAARPQTDNAIPAGKTRADVLAELKQAENNGSDMPGSFLAFDKPAATSANAAPTAVARK
ncbi:MAG TPA: DUF4148 domain-containing protein [Burkholderiaceae bacterium]